jgi:hypothetical protein
MEERMISDGNRRTGKIPSLRRIMNTGQALNPVPTEVAVKRKTPNIILSFPAAGQWLF